MILPGIFLGIQDDPLQENHINQPCEEYEEEQGEEESKEEESEEEESKEEVAENEEKDNL